jgi:hypothetical protein
LSALILGEDEKDVRLRREKRGTESEEKNEQ